MVRQYLEAAGDGNERAIDEMPRPAKAENAKSRPRHLPAGTQPRPSAYATTAAPSILRSALNSRRSSTAHMLIDDSRVHPSTQNPPYLLSSDNLLAELLAHVRQVSVATPPFGRT